MMGNKRKKTVFIILTLIWMTVIFIYSSRNAEESTVDSHFVGEVIAKIFVKDYDKMSEAEQMEYLKSIDGFIRESAHFFEYTVLGVFLINAGYAFGRRKKQTAAVCFAVGSAYAASDEIHQLFVPGRAGQLSDWLVDSCGVAGGIVLVSVCLLLFSGKKAKSE